MSPARGRARRRWRVALIVIPVALLLMLRPAGGHLRAASLLLRFQNPASESAIAGYGKHAVDESDASVSTSHGVARAHVYAPRGVADPPGVVLLHGVHRLGIDEPRLRRFSQAIAGAGVLVLTPELQELADYHVQPSSIETIGLAARTLSDRLGGKRVGVMGMSFAGGLALLAAADPSYSDRMAFVAAVGAHDDLARVSRFFATSEIARPDGTPEHLTAHQYGALVLVYSHADRFFPASDLAAATEALRLWLWEEKDAARARCAELSEASRARMQALFDGRLGEVRDELLAVIDGSEAEMAAVSPHGRLKGVAIPVYLLHGAGDTVIPASETLWLALEVPRECVAAVLVSPALVHVELEGDPGLGEQWALVHFMAGLLDRAETR